MAGNAPSAIRFLRSWDRNSTSHLGLSESGCFLAQLRALPFRLIETGFRAIHPAGKLSDVILVTCPLRKSSFELTERYLKGQQSVLRWLISLYAMDVFALYTPPAGRGGPGVG